ncbi:hypothetical protein MMC07_003248 [Pseudocyphellaria aurata]|nr:hypothetical protein [Pseudocyphellaria aurata]
MDVHNVDQEYAELIESQRQTMRQAQRRQGQRPRDRRSRDFTYTKFMMALLSNRPKENTNLIHSSIIPPAYPPCTTPMNDLRSTAIKNLQLETHHRGTYLLLRSITPPSRMTAIMAVMEDESGDVLMVQLYQQDDEIKRPATDVVNVGTILLIKEPYFKVMADGEYGLRVDHVSDVTHIQRDNARIPEAWKSRSVERERSAESLKAKGNNSMENTKYWDAITEYSDALKCSATADQIDIIRRNRSLAFLKTKQFDAALCDSGFPFSDSDHNQKALFRAADSLYNLDRFSECCQVLELLLTNFPHNSEASMALDRAQSRSLEQTAGVYKFKQLQAKAKKLHPPNLDHATYIGPVEIRQTESKGRGLFVTKPVQAGDLLLCEKAFCRAHADEGKGVGIAGYSTINLLINPSANQGFMGTQPDLIKLIVQKLYRNPSLAPAFTTLYHGTYEGVSAPKVDSEPIVDTFLVERVISLNSFGCPVSSLNTHFRLCGIQSPLSERETLKAHHSCGIWTHASFINHCCISNARRAFIGNLMIVRASRDMEAGTEITFGYHNPEGKSVKELEKKLSHWGFVCGCALCQDARATDAVVFTKRRKLMEDLKQVFKSSSGRRFPLEKAERLLDALNQTYTHSAETVPRLSLWDPQLALTRQYAAQNNASKYLQSTVKVLNVLGYVVVGADSSPTRFTVVRWGVPVDHLVETFLHMRTAFAAMGLQEDSARAKEYAKTVYKIVVGENETFEQNYD